MRPFGIRVYIGNLFPFPVESGSALIDLSKATRLTDLIFRVEMRRVDWANRVLRTITPEHRDLRQIIIYLPHDSAFTGAGASVRQAAGEQIFGQWLELDHILAQLWESRSIRPKILHFAPLGYENDVSESMGFLLPEAMGRGIVDLGEWP